MRTSKRDKNYFSIAGNITSCNGEIGVVIPKDFCPKNSREYDSLLKITGGTEDLLLEDIIVCQGMENALDINDRANKIEILGHFGSQNTVGDQVITIKGGASKITIKGVIYSKGKIADIVIGQWSDECYNDCVDIVLDIEHCTKRKITVVVAKGPNPKIGPNMKILFWKSLGAKIYWWLKWCYVKILKMIKK